MMFAPWCLQHREIGLHKSLQPKIPSLPCDAHNPSLHYPPLLYN
jgi:hypothetical protein